MDKIELLNRINANLKDNNSGDITPAKLRSVLIDLLEIVIPISQVEGLEEALENAGGGSSEVLEQFIYLAAYNYCIVKQQHSLNGDAIKALSKNRPLFYPLFFLLSNLWSYINKINDLDIPEGNKLLLISLAEVVGGAYLIAYATNPTLKQQLSSILFDAIYFFDLESITGISFILSLGAHKQELEIYADNPSEYPFINYSIAFFTEKLKFISGLGGNLITFSIDNNIYEVDGEVLEVNLSNTPTGTFKLEDFYKSPDVTINISVLVPTGYNGVDFDTTLVTKSYPINDFRLDIRFPPFGYSLFKFDTEEEDYVQQSSLEITEPGDYIYIDSNFRQSSLLYLVKARINDFVSDKNLFLDIPIYYVTAI